MSFSQPKISPLRYAALCAGAYFVLAALWINFSTLLAGSAAMSVEEMQKIETYKGLGFVLVTSTLFFLFSLSVFRHISAGARRLIDSQQKLVEAEREAMTGMLASSVAHDVANLLTVLRINAERLETASDISGRSLERVQKLQSGIERLTELIARMRQAGKNMLRTNPLVFDLKSVVAETMGLLHQHHTVRGCSVELKSAGAVTLKGYPILIHQLIMNLVLNAAEAMEGTGRIEIRLRREQDKAVVEVHDNGPGVPKDLRGVVFDAFFTTKKYGSGLGLLSVKSCVDLHGGKLTIQDSDLGGAAFIADLPDLTESRVISLKTLESLNKSTLPETGTFSLG